MDIVKFFKMIEKLYGNYDDNLKVVIEQFMAKSIRPEMVGKIYVSVVYYHKVNFGVPCIATIRECIKKAMEDKEITTPYVAKNNKNKRYSYMEEYLDGDEDLKPVGSLVDDLAKKVKK